MSLRTDWEATAYPLAKAWQALTNISGSSFTDVTISKSDLDTLSANETSGIRIYLGYNTSSRSYQGIAVATELSGTKHNDKVGEGNSFAVLNDVANPTANVMTNPSSQTCDIPSPPPIDKSISWKCATSWAYSWDQLTGISGTAIKAFYIPKEDLAAINEVSNEWGLKIYFGKNSSGDYKSIVVGLDANGNDLVPPNLTAPTSYKAYDFGIPCPNECGSTNQLNTPRK